MTNLSSRRLEACEFPWSDLTDKQQAAVEHVAKLLREAIDSLDDAMKREPQRGPRVRSIRRSQLAFVDGDRGTGKTSVQLTIQGLMNPESPTESGLPEDVQFIHDNRKRFVWLETLDMEPLRKDTNLFAAILARLEDVSGSDARSRSPMAAAISDFDAHDQYLAELSSLQTDAVLAWDKNSSKLSHYSEPQAYAADVLQAEKAGMQLNQKLAKVLNQLAELHVRHSGKGGPLFILPVDDFDLAPTRCLELLRLIRAISTPRLFFVMCGSARLAQISLILQNEGELGSLVQGVAHREYEWEQLIRPTGLEIAANNLRKLLPPEQRASLPAIRLQEALQLKLDTNQTTLKSVLESVTFDVNTNPTNAPPVSMESFLLLDGRWPITSYSATQFLGGTPRQVHDIGMLLDQHTGNQNSYGVDLLETISEEVRREIEENWTLAPSYREMLLTATTSSFNGTIRLPEQLQVRFQFSSPSRKFLQWTSVHERDNDFLQMQRGQSVSVVESSLAETVFSIRDVFHEPQSPKTVSDQQDLPLPPRIAAGLMLLHDTAMSLWGGYLARGSLIVGMARPQSRDVPGTWVSTAVHFDHTKLYLPWPTPIWTTFRQIECFNTMWSTLSRDCQADELGVTWLESILRVVCDEPLVTKQKRNAWNYVHKACKQLTLESPKRHIRKTLRWSTLAAIAEICSPEYSAITVHHIDELFKKCSGLREEFVYQEVAERVRQQRAQTWRAIIQSESDGFETYRLWAAIAPNFVDTKFLALDERHTRSNLLDYENIKDMLDTKPYMRHPINSIVSLVPSVDDLDDRDLRSHEGL